VVARENSAVEARENASVVAWGNASVVARGNVCVWAYSDCASITLFLYAVCYLLSKAKIIKKSETATIITPKNEKGVRGWLDREGIEIKKNNVILFKRVSADYKTQENTKNETHWKIGETLEHPDWKPELSECGENKFHACSRPYFADEFRSNKDDKYIAIEIQKADLYVWENSEYPHKIAFRKGKVLFECNRFGKEIMTNNWRTICKLPDRYAELSIDKVESRP
jgi:hypothetical protein